MDDFQKVVKLLGDMNQRQKEMQNDITDMKSDMSRMNGDITNMKNDITNMKSDMSKMNGDITNMKSDISEMKEELATAKQEREVIRKTVVQNVENIEELKTTVNEIKDDQKSFFEIVGEHEVAIRTLRRKPV
ncbi:hypothetical protein [Gracilibacillus timonensis]|uniref:hypothetical protein n=1 Tax=Gracilibacillus timonensis TaxID=1816696 RepID=UPI0008252A64|nr:hypothetical protein [Gracilibacillus timonensis]